MCARVQPALLARLHRLGNAIRAAVFRSPGKPGYGVIIAVIDDAAKLFPGTTARPTVAAAAAPFFFRHVIPSVTSVPKPAGLSVASGNRRYSFYSPERDIRRVAGTTDASKSSRPLSLVLRQAQQAPWWHFLLAACAKHNSCFRAGPAKT
jgi:hypothetical protein